MSESIWQEETVVKSFETDFEKKWKPACFFQTMQEAATRHAASFGFDYKDMLANNMIWVLARMKVRFSCFPHIHDRVIVTTWPKGIRQKIFFSRDFIFSGPGGERYATATSAWLLMDPAARRMLHPRALPGKVPDNMGKSAMDEALEKINPPGDLPERLAVEAGYSAVDLMGHANNARYVEWISDCFSIEQHRSHRLAWLQVNYLNEVRPGEAVVLAAGQSAQRDGEWLVAGTNRSTGERAFEAALSWERRET